MIPVVFAILWLSQTFITIYNTGNWFGSTYLFIFGNIHSLTVISVCLLYIFLLILLNNHKMPIYIKVVAIVTFISLGLQFNGIIWSLLNLYIGSKTGMPQLNFAFFFLTCVVLFGLHRKYNIVQIHYRTMLVGIGLFILSLAIFIDSGFFYQWALCEQGLAPDPHNWSWGLEQFVAVWMWLGIVKYNVSKENS